MHKLIDYICDELDELERKADKDGKLSMAEIQYMDTLAHAKKNLIKGEEEYSGDYRGDYRSNNGRSYGRSYARRDSMGRYSRDYSMAGDEIIEEIRGLMASAPDERTKKELERLTRRLESM